MVIALLILIVLILLFGAGVVTGWLRNAVGAIFGIALLSGSMILVNVFLGEEAIWWVWTLVGCIFMALAIWAKAYDPEKAARDAALKDRIKIAQQQREDRRKERQIAARAEERLSQQSPLESLKHIFEMYETRTIPTTKAKASVLYAHGDEEGLRQLVESICERNKDHLEFDGKRYIRRAQYAGGRF